MTIEVRIVFANPNLKSFRATYSEEELRHGITIRQNDNTPFPLIRSILVDGATVEETRMADDIETQEGRFFKLGYITRVFRTDDHLHCYHDLKAGARNGSHRFRQNPIACCMCGHIMIGSLDLGH